MSTQCIIQFAVDFIGDLLNAGVMINPNLQAIEDRGRAAFVTFESNSPESSQSAIITEAATCVSSKLTTVVPRILEDIILAIIAVLVMLIAVSLVAVIVIANYNPYALLIVLFLGVLLIVAVIIVLSNAVVINNVDTTACTDTALVKESIFEFQTSQAISSAFCAYASA